MRLKQERYSSREQNAYEVVRQFSPKPTILKELDLDSRGNLFYEKDETDNPTQAFKWRGAVVKLERLCREGHKKVVTASAGNHGQGVALGSKYFGIEAEVFVPENTPVPKQKGVLDHGAELRVVGSNYDETASIAQVYAREQSVPYIPAFDDFDIIDGQGTIGREIYEQLLSNKIPPEDTRVFVAVGGGGQIAGISRELKLLSNNEVKVIGVQVSGSDSAALSFAYNTGAKQYHDSSGNFSRIYDPKMRLGGSYCRLRSTQPNDLVDGTRVNMVGDYCMRNIIDFVDEFIIVEPGLIGKYYLENPNSKLEPAGALSMVGARAYAELPTPQLLNFITIASGSNKDDERIKGLRSYLPITN